MSSFISIIEIPVTDLARAIAFYEAVFSIQIEEAEMDGVQMGIFPYENELVSVVLAKGKDYQPSQAGTLLYLQAGEDLQPLLQAAVQNGGKMLLPKTEISEEMGYYALFIDSEGNKMGLHSRG
jgi:predicted enzyme related to lactoylglutathione lyase